MITEIDESHLSAIGGGNPLILLFPPDAILAAALEVIEQVHELMLQADMPTGGD